MLNKIQKFIPVLLIISFVFSPYFLSLDRAQAQTFPSGYQHDPTSGYSAQSVGQSGKGALGYISGLAPAITQLPLCKDLLQKGKVKNLFPATSWQGATAQTLGSLTSKDWEKIIKKAQKAGSSVSVSDPAVQDALDEIDKKTQDIKESQESQETNDNCLKSIGRLIIKLLLQKITQSTVAWIQTGREGKPAFLDNREEFWGDLAKTEILQFGTEIDNQNLYPYGKDFIIRAAKTFNQKFNQNARYSLDELIQSTTPEFSGQTFKNDFDKGGWNGWVNFTQVDANNPIGFQLSASNELYSRMLYQKRENENMLQEASGFLGDQRCVDPKGLTKEEHNQALIANVPGQEFDINGKVIRKWVVGTCQRWEYVTPGDVIANFATKSIVNSTNDSLLSANDLNDAIAAILDTAIARWVPELINQGVAKLGTSGSDGYLQLDSEQYGYNYSPTQVEVDFNRASIAGFLADNPQFNIRTDLNQALIDEQRIFVQKINEQNIVLKDLIKTTYQLDYCIPGPHPGWEVDSQRTLNAVENAIVSKTPADMKNETYETIVPILKAAGSALGAAIATSIGIGAVLVPGVGAVIGLVFGLLIDLFSGQPKDSELLNYYYAGIINFTTGINIDKTKPDSANIVNKQEVTNGLDKIFIDYVKLIRKYYTPGYLPPVAKEAATKFSFIEGYKEIIKDNSAKSATLNGIIKRLSDLKDEIDTLNSQYNGGQVSTDFYEGSVKTIANAFGRLSADMVSGDDIAYVDNSLKQSKDEIKYIYEDLITGPFGCEQDLEKNNRQLTPNPETYPPDNPAVNPAKTALLQSTLRAEYPFEIWYDYNKYTAGAQLPTIQSTNPNLSDLKKYTNKISTNRMPSYQIGAHGPGFLSTVYFNYSPADGQSCFPSLPIPSGYRPPNNNELDCIDAVKAFKSVNSGQVSVGRNKNNQSQNNHQRDTSFEQIIYVY